MSTTFASKWRPGRATVFAVAGLAYGLALHHLVGQARDSGQPVADGRMSA